MHSAAQQQSPIVENDLARRARREATLADNRIPCSQCGAPADVYLRVAETRLSMPFAASQCDTCAAERIAAAQTAHAPVQLDALSGVPLVTMIDAIDLAQFARECCDGSIHDLPVPAAPSVPEALTLVVTVLEAKLRRSLAPSERVAVESAARSEAHRRYHQRKADLLDAEARCRSVFGVFQQRAVG